MLAETVRQGKLTQTQASRPGLFALHRHGRPGFGKNETAAAQGMTMRQFGQKMPSLTEQAVSQAVTEGRLTQEQAGRLIQRMQQRFNRSHSSSTTQS